MSFIINQYFHYILNNSLYFLKYTIYLQENNSFYKPYIIIKKFLQYNFLEFHNNFINFLKLQNLLNINNILWNYLSLYNTYNSLYNFKFHYFKCFLNNKFIMFIILLQKNFLNIKNIPVHFKINNISIYNFINLHNIMVNKTRLKDNVLKLLVHIILKDLKNMIFYKLYI